MPLAVSHVILTVILVDIYRDYLALHKRYFTRYTLLVAAVAGLFPDVDILFTKAAALFNMNVPAYLGHGGVTHTPFFALLFIFPGFYLWNRKKHIAATYFFVISFALGFHIALDFFIGGGAYEGIMLLYPFTLAAWKIHVITLLGMPEIPAVLDAIILLTWLWHEEVLHKISGFI